ncbi:hypothetical protein QJS10_CPB04g01820 [Acorus calamus]|uniref:Uncharacterized protein n=1 Tax=Acorus calamus TaxID=4465 RepID=A0AAV9EZT5_ACOCL|nr:hypothetical protein QJS10_CPB04g01820 [Acorus calamus]
MARKHQVSSGADHTNPTPPFQPGVGSIEDGGHMYRRRRSSAFTARGYLQTGHNPLFREGTPLIDDLNMHFDH